MNKYTGKSTLSPDFEFTPVVTQRCEKSPETTDNISERCLLRTNFVRTGQFGQFSSTKLSIITSSMSTGARIRIRLRSLGHRLNGHGKRIIFMSEGTHLCVAKAR